MLAGHGTDEGEEFTEATEENQIRFIDRWQQRGIGPDVWWIDAGWYPCRDQDDTEKTLLARHRNLGARSRALPPQPGAVSDRASRNGADLLLWFEPERSARHPARCRALRNGC